MKNKLNKLDKFGRGEIWWQISAPPAYGAS